MKELININEIYRAKNNISKVVLKSSYLKNKYYSDFYNSNIFIKREDEQIVKSFKIRGAFNKIRSLKDYETKRGIVCASAGNHAQGFAITCSILKIKGTVFMPKSTPDIKIKRVKKFGKKNIQIVLHGNDFYDAYDKSIEFSKQNDLTFIHPFDDLKVIEGQATLFLEILNQSVENIDFLLVPIGGGGLISGAINVFKQLSKKTKIIGVETAGASSMKRSIQKGMITVLNKIDNFVDGAAVRKVGNIPFKICKEYLDEIIIVDEGEICKTVIDLEEYSNITAEPSGAMSLTALRQIKDKIKGKNVACLICGGNNDKRRLPEIKTRSKKWILNNLKNI